VIRPVGRKIEAVRMALGEAAGVIDFPGPEARFDNRTPWIITQMRRDNDVAVFIDLHPVFPDRIDAAGTAVTHNNSHRQVIIRFTVGNAVTIGIVHHALPLRQAATVRFDSDYLYLIYRLLGRNAVNFSP